MPAPGYGPSGFLSRPTGLHSWTTQSPFTRKSPEAPPVVSAVGLGLGSIPRKTFRRTNEVFRVKEA